jgi:hypothetical protein
VTAGGTASQPQPDLKLDWTPIEAYLDALHAKIATANTAERKFVDDMGATVDSIGGRFSSSLQTFTWTDSILDTSIPAAAVRSIAETEHSVADLYDGLQAGPRAAAPEDPSSTDAARTLRSLFEQAVNAGLVTKEDQRASETDAARSCLELEPEDSIDIYIKYAMTKTRR